MDSPRNRKEHPPPRRSQGTPLAVKGAGQDPCKVQ
nr:MAG TPA: hypothetical protein [Caudoviricetes sp.]